MTQAIAIQDEEYHERFSPRVWRRLLGFARPYWRLYVGMIVTSLALAGTEAAFPLVTKAVIDDIQAHGRGANLLAYAAMYVGLTASLAMEILCFIRLAGKISTHISHDIRQAGFGHLQELSFSFYDRRPAGWLVARLTSDCDRLSRTVAWGFLDLAWGSCLVAGIIVVSFARAVLADPQIFVMDEATSSVDTETERLIQDGLHAVLAGRISFVIAHRLSTIRSADLILLIDGGIVIEQGTHAELIGRRGRYYHLYTNQFAEERAEAVLRGGESQRQHPAGR